MEIIDPVQNLVQRAMQGAALRQQVLTQNLANADTPGYQRQEVDFHTALQQASDGLIAPQNVQFQVVTQPGAVQANGNGVDLDKENAALSANALEYETLAKIYSARFDMLRAAAGNG